MGSGDGWTRCALGHTHWGRFGAAGLLISDGERVILQHRAPWTHEGGTWGIPGGARDDGEGAVDAALREAFEEAGLAERDIEPLGLYVVDHGGWTYTTVLARPRAPLFPVAANAESVEVRWIPLDDVAGLSLHTGFSSAWPQVQQQPDRLLVLVGPELTGHPQLRVLAGEGIPTTAVPAGFDTARLQRVIPQVEFVADASAAAARAARTDGATVVLLELADLTLLVDGGEQRPH